MLQLAVGLAAICAVVYLVRYCHAPASWPKSAIKTASVLLLALAAWWAEASPLLVTALTLCALGDYLLSRDNDTTFLAGVGAFAAGHVAYITLFLTHDAAQTERLLTSPRLWVAIIMTALALIMARVLFSRAGDLRFAVLAYVPVIVGMGIAALVLPGTDLLVFAILGAMLFVSSDFVLALEMFVLGDTAPARRITPFYVWSSYWMAQFLIFIAIVWEQTV